MLYTYLFLFFMSMSCMMAQDPKPEGKPEEKANEPAKPEHGGKETKEGEDPAKNEAINHSGEYFAEKPFFKLAPLVVTIFKNNLPTSFVHIESSLETAESEWEKIRLKIPVLYNYLFTDLYQSLNTLWDQVTPITPATLEKRFQFVCDTLFGKDNVKKVTISLVLVVPKKD